MKNITQYLITILTFAFLTNAYAQSFSGPDFNGDGIADLSHVWNDGGNLSVSALLSDGLSFTEEKWVNQSGSYNQTQRWFYADFNGDSFTDAACLFEDNGMMSCDVYVATDTDSDFVADSFVKGSWAVQSGAFDYADRWFVSDFNGDFNADLARVYNENGARSIDVHLSNGSGFDPVAKWRNQNGSVDPDELWLTGDFDGDFDTDFLVVDDDDTINMRVFASSGSSFSRSTWQTSTDSRNPAFKWVALDFNGDGLTDVATLWDDNGSVSIDVHVSTGSSFVKESWAVQDGPFVREHRWFVGDFNGDFLPDIARLWDDGGLLSIESYDSTGVGFSRRTMLTQGRPYRDQEDYIVGDFNGDFVSDIAVTWGDQDNWYCEVIESDPFGVSSTVSPFSTLALGDYFDRHNLVDPILGDNFVSYTELRGATPPGVALQSVLDSGADLQLVKNAIYNENGVLYYKANYQRIRTFDAKFISDYAIIRMQIDQGDRDTLLIGQGKSYLHLENIAIDGNKYTLGSRERLAGEGQGAMMSFLENRGAWLRRCVFYNTRVWSTCSMSFNGNGSYDHIIENNYVLGAGNDPRGNGAAPGELGIIPGVSDYIGWSDGFSVSAYNTTVRDNFIMDTTDVGIVIFGAPGSEVQNNVVANYSRSTHGGINFVDSSQYIGTDNTFGTTIDLYDYRDLTIEDNRVAADGSRVMIGYPFGDAIWGAGNSVFDFEGSVVRNNSAEGGAFGYGYALHNILNIDFYGNVSAAIHSGRGSGGSSNGGMPDLAVDFLWDPSRVTYKPGFQIGDFTANTVEIEDLLFHHSKPQNAAGYSYYAYTDPEAEAMVTAAYWEMLGRLPSGAELTSGKNLFLVDPDPGTTLNEAELQTSDAFRQDLMLLSEFINKFGALSQDDLHVFRTARWRDRIMANDELQMIVTGNYPDPNVVYDNSEAQLEYTLAGANSNITSITPTLPTYMQQGDIVTVDVTVQNTGTLDWANSASDPRKFAFASVGDNTEFGITRYYIPDGVTVAAGQSYTFTMDIVAPPVAWAGEGNPTTTFFPIDFRMIQESEGFFGDSFTDHLSGTHQIEVENSPEPPPAPIYDATFISQTLQGDPQINDILPGASFTVNITMMNSGNMTTTPWSKPMGFHLGSENPKDNTTWSTNRIKLEDSIEVESGEIVTFQAVLVAPATVGTYDFQWQMLGNGWFGDFTPNLSITVSNSAPAIGLTDSEFVSIDAPGLIEQGLPFTANVTFKNTGTTTWTPGNNYKLANMQSFVDRTNEHFSTITSEFSDSYEWQDASALFDNEISTKFYTPHSSSWVQHQFGQGNQYEITKYIVTSAPDEGPGSEEVPNSSFEGSANWTLNNATISTEEAHTGNSSICMSSSTGLDTGNSTQTVTGLKNNTDYHMSFWLKKAPGTDGSLRLDTNDVYDATCGFRVDGGQPVEWTYYEGVFNTGVPDPGKTGNTGEVRLRIRTKDFFSGTVYVDDLSIVEVGAANAAGDPASWTLQGSNDGSSWTTVDSRSGINFPNRNQRLEFNVSTPGSYEYYRLDATNNSGSHLQFGELELFTNDNVFTSATRALMSPGATVLPGENYTFALNLTAPAVSVDTAYNLQTSMIKEDVAGEGFFGEHSPNQVINVTVDPPPVNNSVFLGQTGIPAAIKPGANFVANLQFQNTGNTTWSLSDPNGTYKIGSQNPQDNNDWGTARFDLSPTDVILPGETLNIEVIATAPALTTPGVPENFNFQWKMIQEGVEWFGADSTNVVVSVDDTAADVPFDDSQFVSQVMPLGVTPNETFEVRVTYENTGTTTWTAASNYQVGSENPTDNTIWGASLFNMDPLASVAPGETFEFIFNVTAPATSGTYDSRWRLNAPSRGRFGGLSQNASIIVNPNLIPSWNTGLVSQTVMLGTTSIAGTMDGAVSDDDTLTYSVVSFDVDPAGGGDWLTLNGDGSYSGTVPAVLGTYIWTISATDGNYAPVNGKLEIHVASGQWFVGYAANEASTNPDTLGFWNMDPANFGIGAGQLDQVLQNAIDGGSDAISIYPAPGQGKFGDAIFKERSVDRDRYAVVGTDNNAGDAYFPAGGDPSITVEAWFKSDSATSGNRTIIDTHKNNGNTGYRLFTSGDAAAFGIRNSSGEHIAVGTTQLIVGQWHHIAGTWDADSDILRVYLDGVLEASVSAPNFTLTDSSVNPITFGTLANGTDRFGGHIDEVRISSKAIPFIFPTDFPVWNDIAVSKFTEAGAFTGSLVADVTDNNTITFTKTAYLGGPGGAADWLTIAPNGDLSGTAPAGAGTYAWTVTADDGTYDPVPVTVQVFVANDTWDQEYNGLHPNTVNVWHMSAADQDNSGLTAGMIDLTNMATGNLTSTGRFGTALENLSIAEWGVVNGTSLRDDVYFPAGATPSITVEMWVNVASTGASSSIVHNRSTGGYEMYMVVGGKIRWTVRSMSQVNYHVESDGFQITEGQWHHLAGTYDAASNTSRLYIDGVERGSLVIPGFTLEDAKDTISISLMNDTSRTRGVLGQLDELRISDTAYHYVPLGPPAGSYDAWVIANFTAGEIAAGDADRDADADGDGISNLVEFSSDSDPKSGDDANTVVPTVVGNGSNFDFTFKRSQAALTYTVQTSSDLNTWSDYVQNPDVVGGDVTVQVPQALMSNGKLFIRLKVDE